MPALVLAHGLGLDHGGHPGRNRSRVIGPDLVPQQIIKEDKMAEETIAEDTLLIWGGPNEFQRRLNEALKMGYLPRGALTMAASSQSAFFGILVSKNDDVSKSI